MEETKLKENRVLSTRTTPELKEQVELEAGLRGHTVSEALHQIIKLGLPKYLKRVPKKYQHADSEAA